MLPPGLKRITSRHHEIVGRCRAAASGDDPATMLLDGAHLVAEALAAPLTVTHIMVSADAAERDEVRLILARAARAAIEAIEVSEPVLSAISPVRSPSGIVALAERPAPAAEPGYGQADRPVVIACEIQDPGNLGAIIRVAEAAGARSVVLAGACADPWGWRVLRGSMGSALRLPLLARATAADAIAEARRGGSVVVAAVPAGGTPLFDTDLRGPVAIAIGSEGRGLPPPVVDAADRRVSVPMTEPVDSLNAAVTAAVLLY